MSAVDLKIQFQYKDHFYDVFLPEKEAIYGEVRDEEFVLAFCTIDRTHPKKNQNSMECE